MRYLLIIALLFSFNVDAKEYGKKYSKTVAKQRAAKHPQGSGNHYHRYVRSYPGNNKYTTRYRTMRSCCNKHTD